jgi:hypothetical protein
MSNPAFNEQCLCPGPPGRVAPAITLAGPRKHAVSNWPHSYYHYHHACHTAVKPCPSVAFTYYYTSYTSSYYPSYQVVNTTTDATGTAASHTITTTFEKPQHPKRQCLVTDYTRNVTIVPFGNNYHLDINKNQVTAAEPSHNWLHALDPDSYELGDDDDDDDIATTSSSTLQVIGNAWPNCKDASCRNYYKRYQTDNCSPSELST